MKSMIQITGRSLAIVLSLCVLLTAWLRPEAAESASNAPEPTIILVVLEPGRTDTTIDLFLNAYGGTVLSGNNVIAPGTENAVSVRFAEPNGVPFSYKAYLKTEVLRDGTPSDTELPLMISAEGGEYRPFSDWRAGEEGPPISAGSLTAGKQGSLDFSWKWDFERGDDEGDVELSFLSDLSAIVKVIVITEAEEPATEAPTTEPPATEEPTTEAPTTEEPTTEAPTTEPSTTEEPTTVPSSEEPTTEKPTEPPDTSAPSTNPPTEAPTTMVPTTAPAKAPTTKAAPDPGGQKPLGVDDSPVGIIVLLVIIGVAGVLLIVLHKHKKTRNE